MKELKRLRKLKAQKFIQTLAFKLRRVRIRSYLKDLTTQYKRNAIFVQKYLKGYLAKNKRDKMIKARDDKIERLRILKLKNEAAITI